MPTVKVEQPPGGGDQQVDALVAQHALLRADRHAAIDGAHADLGVLRVLVRVLFDLGGELARRDQDQRPQRAVPVEQPREDRQQERSGLATSGLGRGDQVMAG